MCLRARGGDGVGDPRPPPIAGRQGPGVVDERPVVGRHVAEHLAREHGTDDGAHARLPQPLGEAVEVRVVARDEHLLRAAHVDLGDRLRAVWHEGLGELPRQPGSQPGLPAGVREPPRPGPGGDVAESVRPLLAGWIV